MKPSAPLLFLDPAGQGLMYLRIARALREEIQRGRFKPGDSLPGYRTLAEQLSVSRNTVMAAYRELQAEGWLSVAQRSGCRVARSLPVHAAAQAPEGRPAPSVAAASSREVLQLASGNPDPRLLPSAALAQAYRRALTLNQGAALAVEDPLGHPRLREALAALLASTRAIAADPGRLLVARTTQLAATLLAQALVRPGDAVAVEALGDRGAREAFARAGARCLPVPVDGEGLVVPELEALLAQGPVRAVLVSPGRHYPTLAPLAAPRRARLLELAAHHRFLVVEADLDGEFQFEGRPAAPLAAQDRAGVVVYLGLVSRAFTPSLRLAFVHGPAEVLRALVQVRQALDRQGDPVLERAMAELLEDGEVQRHLARMHPLFRRRRDVLCQALEEALGDAVQLRPPEGGLALWVRTPGRVDVDAWAARALEAGVAFQPGSRFAFHGGPVPGFRLGFAAYDEERLRQVATRMAATLAPSP